MKARAGGPGPLAQRYEDDSAMYGGIITQVTSRGPVPVPPRPPAAFAVAGPAGRPAEEPSLGDQLKQLLCCSMGITRSGYVKADSEGSGRHGSPGSLMLIGPQRPQDRGKKTLVLDLDETLVHSSFKPVPNPDYIIPVDIDGKVVDVYVLKRPWCDHFMACAGVNFEVVVFTASLAKYADPLLDLLDKGRIVRWRLFREACVLYQGNFVKNLATLGRDLRHTIIVDNSPHSYIFQPENAMPVGTFIDDMEDRELLDLLPLLTQMEKVDDVRKCLEDVCSATRTTDGGRLEPILAL